MPPPPRAAVLRARAAIAAAAPSLSTPAVSVTALQSPPIRNYFQPQSPVGQTAPGIDWSWLKWLQQLFSTVKAQTTSLEDTAANRANYPPGNYNPGTTYYETDTGLLYIDNGTAWLYVSGIQQATQATLPTGLGAGDAGLLVDVSDYGHLLQWSGTGWEWGPGDAGSGQISAFLSAPGTGWHLCDGSSVDVLNSNGTVSSVTLPDYATAAYLKFGTTLSAGPNLPSGVTTAVSAGTPAGTVSEPTFTGASDATSIESADATVQSGTGASVAAASHTHTVTPTGTVSQPTFTGTPLPTHVHGPGTIQLENTVLLAYFRQ